MLPCMLTWHSPLMSWQSNEVCSQIGKERDFIFSSLFHLVISKGSLILWRKSYLCFISLTGRGVNRLKYCSSLWMSRYRRCIFLLYCLSCSLMHPELSRAIQMFVESTSCKGSFQIKEYWSPPFPWRFLNPNYAPSESSWWFQRKSNCSVSPTICIGLPFVPVLTVCRLGLTQIIRALRVVLPWSSVWKILEVQSAHKTLPSPLSIHMGSHNSAIV